MNDDLEVVCKSCRYCRSLTPAGRNKYDIECDHNPNLGAVGKNYVRCPGFAKN